MEHVFRIHYDDVIMGPMASQMTNLTIVYSTVYSDADQRKHLSSASLAFVRGSHRRPVNSPHKWPVTRKMSPFDDVIMLLALRGGGPLATDGFPKHRVSNVGLRLSFVLVWRTLEQTADLLAIWDAVIVML